MASLFDTGAFERLRRGERAAVSLSIRLFPPMICLHVAAECLYGAEWAEAGVPSRREMQEALGEFVVLQPTLETATIYARL